MLSNNVGQSVKSTLYILSHLLPVINTWSFPRAIPFRTFSVLPRRFAGQMSEKSLKGGRGGIHFYYVETIMLSIKQATNKVNKHNNTHRSTHHTL